MALTTLDELETALSACQIVRQPPAKRPVSQADFEKDPENYIIIGAGSLTLRCKAQSKRSKQRCKAPAVRGKLVCRFHGGRSTGPRTPEGKQRSGFQPIHGRQTNAKREQRSLKVREMRVLKRVIKEQGL